MNNSSAGKAAEFTYNPVYLKKILKQEFDADPDAVLYTADILAAMNKIGLKARRTNVRNLLKRAVNDPDFSKYKFEKTDKLKNREKIWTITKNGVFACIDGYEIKKSFIERLKEYLPRGYKLELYELYDCLKEEPAFDKLKDFQKNFIEYLKKEGIDAHIGSDHSISCEYLNDIPHEAEILSQKKSGCEAKLIENSVKKIDRFRSLLNVEYKRVIGNEEAKQYMEEKITWLDSQKTYEENMEFDRHFWRADKIKENLNNKSVFLSLYSSSLLRNCKQNDGTIKIELNGRKISEAEKEHCIWPIYFCLKKYGEQNESDLMRKLNKPLYAIRHGLEVLARKNINCPYSIEDGNHGCVNLGRSLIKKVSTT